MTSPNPAETSRSPNCVVKEKPIALLLPQQQLERVEKLAAQELRKVATFARLLMNRGFARYQQAPAALLKVAVAGQLSKRAVALRLTVAELDAVTEAAETEKRKLAEFARLLVLLGLAEYEAERAS